MKKLLNNDVIIDLYDIEGKEFIGNSRLSIIDKGCDVITSTELKNAQLKSSVGIFANNHVIILVDGFFLKSISSSIKSEYVYRFRESLYSRESSFDDLTEKVSIQIPQLARWFFRGYYDLNISDEDKITIKIEREKSIKFPTSFGELELYYESNFNANDVIKVHPLTYIILKFDKKIERSIAFDLILKAIAFFQSFFYSTLQASTLIFFNGKTWLESHSEYFPVMREYTEEQFKHHSIVEFHNLKKDLKNAINEYFRENILYYFTFQMYEDAINNPQPVNRFLSAFRIFERLGKHLQSITDPTTKGKAANLFKDFKEENNLGKSRSDWIFYPFLMLNSIVNKPSNKRLINFVNTRNVISHGDYNGLSKISNYELQQLANELNGYNKAVIFKMLGFEDLLCRHANSYFSDMEYFDSYLPSEHSMNFSSSLYSKK